MDNVRPKKSGLGRGLGNLLDTGTDFSAGKKDQQKQDDKSIQEINVDKIRANPDNPRKNFEKTSIDELANTIKEFGLLQPILVLEKEDHYIVISGERRLRACRQLNLEKIPCIVKKLGAQETLEVSLIENIQREQLNPIEEGVVYKSLLEKHELTQEQLSGRVGKNRATIANRIRLLQLPLSLQTALADQRVTEGQVRPLLGISNENMVQRLASEILTHQLSARQVEDLVKKYKGLPAKSSKAKKKEAPEIAALKKEIMEILQTRVDIRHNPKNGRGSIIIDYFSLEECNRIIQQLKSVKK